MGIKDWFLRADVPDEGKPETRQVAYADEVISHILARAGAATTADVMTTLALEAAAGMVGRAFAAATVDGDLGPELEPHLEFIGRSFIRRGESLLVPDRTRFERAAAWTITGGADWAYEVSVARPDGTGESDLTADQVLHFRTAESRAAPWRGRGPLQVGRTGAALTASLESSLANEAGGPHGHLIPVPDNPDDELEGLRSEISGLAGRALLVETMRENWGGTDQRAVSSRSDWVPHRIGLHPPDSVVNLMVEHRRLVFVACGIPDALLHGSDGTARREAFRQFVWGTLAPLGYVLEREVRGKLQSNITLKWDRLRAADIAGRARAYGSLVTAEMDKGRAAQLVGFEE